ncbi:transcription elongation factor GreA [Geoalkalibacter sp.]|uniref:transcription elongation factor GreA n=1 Tax=Geoalkalibacter sp. TaxID=3041440 RepID=UPI00272E3F8B|nr:transcription elongation factor GreA [Geoalkalibacter sp.]
MTQSIPMTREGYQRLQEELKKLIREDRPKVVQDIAEARGHGDLSENAEYDAAKERQAFIEGRIQEINDKLSRAQVINPAELDTDKVVFGARVTLFDVDSGNEVTYQIVGEDEADLKFGKISVTSPVGKALIGHKLDEEVTVKIPSGLKTYEIIDIKYE